MVLNDIDDVVYFCVYYQRYVEYIVVHDDLLLFNFVRLIFEIGQHCYCLLNFQSVEYFL